MESDCFKEASLNDSLAAMIYVITDKGRVELSDAAVDMLSVWCSFLQGEETDSLSLSPLMPDDLSDEVYEQNDQRFIMSSLVILPFLDGKPSKTRQQLVNEYADAVNLDTNTLSLLSLLAKQRIIVSELSLLRQHRAAIISGEKSVKAIESWQHMQTRVKQPHIVSRYQTLSEYPKESFGYALYRFYQENGLPIPGEPYGVENGLGVINDIAYVLSGYDLSDKGRLEQAFFQAGFVEHYGLLFPLISLMHYYLDSVIDSGEEKLKIETRPLVSAYQRGKKMTVDLYDNWDYWTVFPCSLKETRATLGCAPIDT